MNEIFLPRLDQDMTEGAVSSWLVSVGDSVRPGDPIAEIETDKVMMVIDAEAAGIVTELLVPAGDLVPVGTPIARIGNEIPAMAPATPGSTPLAPPSSVPESPAPAAVPASAGLLPVDRRGWHRPHPLSPRRRAAGVTPQPEPVEIPVARQDNPPAPREIPAQDKTPSQLTGRRAAIAQQVERSWAIPQFSAESTVDVTAISTALPVLAELAGTDVTVTDTLLLAFRAAAAGVPEINGRWIDAEGTYLTTEFMPTILVATDSGVVPACLGDLRQSGFAELVRRRTEVVRRARTGKMRPADLEAGTFAISNLGASPIDRFNALLLPPMLAISAIGRIRDEGARRVMSVTTTVDHRGLDGDHVARFHTIVLQTLANPAQLMLAATQGVGPHR